MNKDKIISDIILKLQELQKIIQSESTITDEQKKIDTSSISESEVTVDEVRAIVAIKIKHHSAKVKEVLLEFGIKSLPELQPAFYADFITKINAI